ncbi:DCD (Development and cell death) domain protein [Arachis hypogaea]|nr:DCD (Development and cell death) domain protein [Arachis hypogaea]
MLGSKACGFLLWFESPLAVFYVWADMRSRKLNKRNKVLGGFPEFGAIFMSNRSALQECFEKRLFGLPVGYSDFVRHVKFKIIWHCDPLSEDEFYGAIRDNYFGPHKFNFGLTKEQDSLLQSIVTRMVVGRTKTGLQVYKRCGKKGKFAEVEIFRRKLDKNHGSSDILELQVETFLASIACGKSEITHSDDGYDPENPGFHHLVVPKDFTAACNFAEPEEEGFDVGECTEQTELEKMDDLVTSSYGSPCSGLDNSSLASISLSDAIGFQSKPGSNHCEPSAKAHGNENDDDNVDVTTRAYWYLNTASNNVP